MYSVNFICRKKDVYAQKCLLIQIICYSKIKAHILHYSINGFYNIGKIIFLLKNIILAAGNRFNIYILVNNIIFFLSIYTLEIINRQDTILQL